MLKKFFVLTMAAMLTSVIAFGHEAEAASLSGKTCKKIDFSDLLNTWHFKVQPSQTLVTILEDLGIPVDLSQLTATASQPTGQAAAPVQPSGNQTDNESTAPSTTPAASKPSTGAPKSSSSSSATTPSATAVNDAMNTFEQQVVQLVNEQRAQAGLKPLQATNDTLNKMARAKSTDMRDHNYFDHQSPTYGSPFDMMKTFGISYAYAGENIAAGQKTPQDVMTAWMNSPGHRANILNPNFTTIGVGYVSGGSYGCYWTQEFIGN
ncbi:MAG: CAP domain-containing protein [Sporolactobacillus sp.]